MRRLFLALPALVAGGLLTPTAAEAQGATRERAYWYVSSYQVDWSRVDSLKALLRRVAPVDAEERRRGRILDSRVLFHHTGTPFNVMIMTKYPSWAMINDTALGPAAFRRIFPDSVVRRQLNEGFGYVLGPATHQDAIYEELED